MHPLEMTGVFHSQHLHHRTVDTVDGEVPHTPGGVARLLHPGQALFVPAHLDDPLAGAAGLHGYGDLLVILLDHQRLEMSPHGLRRVFHPGAEVVLLERFEGGLAFDGVGFSFRPLHGLDAVIVVDIGE